MVERFRYKDNACRDDFTRMIVEVEKIHLNAKGVNDLVIMHGCEKILGGLSPKLLEIIANRRKYD